MKPKSIFLIRHGESAGNVDKSVYKTVPDWKVPLTQRGIEQAIEAGRKLYKLLDVENYYINSVRNTTFGSLPYRKLVQFYSSPWYRSRQTTANIKIGMDLIHEEVKEDPRIREQEWGNFQETHLQEKVKNERRQYGSFFYRMPHGESGADVFDRVTTFIETLHRDFEKEKFPSNLIISTHGLTIKLFFMRWFHWTVEEFEQYDTPDNCEIFQMDLQGDNRYKLMTDLKVYAEP